MMLWALGEKVLIPRYWGVCMYVWNGRRVPTTFMMSGDRGTLNVQLVSYGFLVLCPVDTIKWQSPKSGAGGVDLSCSEPLF